MAGVHFSTLPPSVQVPELKGSYWEFTGKIFFFSPLCKEFQTEIEGTESLKRRRVSR